MGINERPLASTEYSNGERILEERLTRDSRGGVVNPLKRHSLPTRLVLGGGGGGGGAP